MRKQNILLISVILVFLIFYIINWRFFQYSNPGLQLNNITTYKPCDIGYRVYTRMFNLSGYLNYKVSSNRVILLTKSKKVFFDKLLLIIYNTKGRNINCSIQADQAYLSNNLTISFYGHVRVNIFKSPHMKYVVTSYAILNLKSRVIMSDSQIILYGDCFNLRSIGIYINLQKGVVKLLNRVKARYFV